MARRGTNAGKQRTLHQAGYSGDGRNIRTKVSRTSPTLYAGVFGHIEPVYCTLTQLDYLAPHASGLLLPRPPVSGGPHDGAWERTA